MPTDVATSAPHGMRAPAAAPPCGSIMASAPARWLALGALLAGCASPAAPPLAPAPAPAPAAAASAPAASAPAPAPAPAPTPAIPATPAEPSAPGMLAAWQPEVFAALAHADRLRSLNTAELAAEVARLLPPDPSPLRQVQLALALLQTQQAAEAPRIQALLQSVLASNTQEARSLHPLARLLAAQHAQQRRLEEQLERQGQQLRDSQRRLEQLSERLEALRAIERSMPTRPVR